jgi:hypothetical protein
VPITNVSVRIPVPSSGDPRYTVTFFDSDLPWPVRLHFILVGHGSSSDDVTDKDYFSVGFEVGENHERSRGEEPHELKGITRRLRKPELIHDVVERFDALEQQARDILYGSQKLAVTGDSVLVTAERPRSRRMITPHFLKSISEQVARHEKAGRSPAKEIAKDEGVNIATAYRWIQAAKEAEDAR